MNLAEFVSNLYEHEGSVWINPDHVIFVRKLSDDQTIIHCVNDFQITIEEEIDMVLVALHTT